MLKIYKTKVFVCFMSFVVNLKWFSKGKEVMW